MSTTPATSAAAPPSVPGAAVALSGVTLRFRDPDGGDGVLVLDGIDLDIPPGQFVAVVGPSGCGKTTILNMLAGLLRPTTGSVRRDGLESVATSREIGYMIARGGLAPWRTARRNVEFGLELRGVGRAERRTMADAQLAQLGLTGFEHAYPSQLSHGMRQRVAIARTLVVAPRLLLMDEPFGALDAITRGAVQQQFVELWEQRRPTVLFVTHDLGEALALADRIVVMSQRPGRIRDDRLVPFARPRDTSELVGTHAFVDLERELRGLMR